MHRKYFAFLLCICFALPLGACAPAKNTEAQPVEVKKYENLNESPTDGGTLDLCLFETDTLNPLITQNTDNIHTLMPIYDSLFTVNQDFSYTANLCESYSVSDNGYTYTFILKSGISFHNGAPLTAKDAEFSLRLLMESGSPYSSKLADITSFSADTQALKISLRRPVANFPALLDFPVISAHSSVSTQAAIADKAEYIPNGTGLYKLQSYKKNKELLLVHNEAYHRNVFPHINNILIYIVNDRNTAISMLENLRVDILSSNVASPDEYTPKRSVSSLEYPSNRFTFLGFNHAHPVFRNSQTRRAIAAAIDRNALVHNQLSDRAVACDIPLHPQSWLYRAEREMTAYDPEQARKLLAEDGWLDSDNDGRLDRVFGEQTEILEFSILVNQENTQRVKLANEIKSMLEEIGIWVYVTQLPYAEYNARLNQKDYDAAICEVDISDNYDLKFLFQTGYNIFNASSELLDNLMLEADKSDDPALIQELYREMCTLLQQDMPVSGLYFENNSVIFDESLRGNIIPGASNIYSNIYDWFIQ